jgi:hypothetical protein
MPIRGFVNNYSTTLDGTINNSTTTITVNDATGISAELALCNYIALTIDDGTNVEIVHVTSVSSNDLTVSRGQEGSAANGFADGTTIECRPTRNAFKSASQANVQFTGLTAGDWRVDFTRVYPSSSDDFAVVQGTGGTPTWQTSTYYHSGLNMTYGSGDAGNRASAASQLTIHPSVNNNAANFLQGFIEIGDVGNASTKKTINYQAAQGNQARWTAGACVRDNAEAVTGLKFFFVSASDIKSGARFLLSKRLEDIS